MKKLFLPLIAIAAVAAIALTGCKAKNTHNTNNTPLPIAKERTADWVCFGNDSDGSRWYIFSQVNLDSCAYAVSLKAEYPKEEVIEHKILIDTTFTSYKEYTQSGTNWEPLSSDSMYQVVAPIAKMFYEDQTDKPLYPSKMSANWGGGNWVKYQQTDSVFRYVKDDIQQTDSSYIFWRFTSYTKVANHPLEPYFVSGGDCKQIAYGYLFKEERLKTGFTYIEYETYYVNKWGEPIWAYKDKRWFVDEGSENLDDILAHTKSL